MLKELLDQLTTAVGEAPASAKEVTFEGADPIFPTKFRFGEAGAALIAASGLMAARIWQDRTGEAQEVFVPVEHAAAAMGSGRYTKVEPIEGQPPLDVTWNKRGNVGLGAFTSKDGRLVYLQREFEYHRERQEAVLQCEDDRESMAAAISQWEGQALEYAIVAAGACAGLVRSEEEWAAHPQGRALTTLPLVEILKIGDSEPEPLSANPERPLSGLRVLDLTRVLAGPTAARTLAEHGADVLRIGSKHLVDERMQAIDTGHGKRAAHLDLNDGNDMAKLHELIRGADVFSQAFRPGSLAKKGLAPEDVAKVRPGVVYVTLSAFGHEGPWAARRGFDSIVQNVSGIALANGNDGQPRATPNPLDYGTGYLAAFATMAALRRRAREGGSYLVRVSLAQTGTWMKGLPRLDASQYEGLEPMLTGDRLARWLTTYEGPLGRVSHLKPVAQLSKSESRWDLPAVPIGYNEPEWLAK
jgi:crotonobetainyl-CoA:carnitine CoA-transferase CaiB-like acyl-CoA transferase